MTCVEIPNIPMIFNELYSTSSIAIEGDLETFGVQLDEDDSFEFEYIVKHPSAFDMMLGNIDINGWRPFVDLIGDTVEQIKPIDEIYIEQDGFKINAKLTNSGNILRIGELELIQNGKCIVTIPAISKSYSTLSDHFSLESSANQISGLSLEPDDSFSYDKYDYKNLDEYLRDFLPLDMHSTINDAFQTSCNNK